MDIKQKVGYNLKKIRLSKGWSQEKLALDAGLDRTYIQSIEKGERNISIVVAEKLALALNVDLQFLFSEIN